MSSSRDMDALLQGFVDRGLSGCGCAVAQRGKIIYENYFGYSDIENRTPITRGSVFRQFSLTKIPLYTACMMLYEKGKFLLSDPISDFFPEWKNTCKAVVNPNGTVDVVPTEGPVRVRDIFSMTCGLPYFFFPTKNITQTEMLRLWKKLRAGGSYSLREEIRVRTVMDRAAGANNGSVGAFGWTGGSGTWCEIDPSEGVSIVYMHNQEPNEEEFHHLRIRAVGYGLVE